MIHKKIFDLPSFLAGDKTRLKEVFHPQNGDPDLGFSVAFASIDSGKSSIDHSLEQGELYLILKGQGTAFVAGNSITLEKGHVLLVEKGERQYISNTGVEPLEFYCIVSPAWTSEGEKIFNEKS